MVLWLDGVRRLGGGGSVEWCMDWRVEGRGAYRNRFQPSTKPERVSSPIVGAASSVRMARTTGSSRERPRSWR